MKTLQEAVEYTYNYINDYEKNDGEILDKDALHDMLEEELLEAVEGVLSTEDMKARVSNKDETYLDKILNEKLGDNYPILLQEMTNDILNEYVLNGGK